MADIRAGIISQAVTLKDFQRLMDLFTSNVLKAMDDSCQKNSVEMHIDLPPLHDDVMPLQEEGNFKPERKDNIVKVLFQSDVSILKELQADATLQFDTFGNKKDTSKNGLKKISFRRDRHSQLAQPQIKDFKFLKMELAEGAILKELMEKKDWKKYRKKGIVDQCFVVLGGGILVEI